VFGQLVGVRPDGVVHEEDVLASLGHHERHSDGPQPAPGLFDIDLA